MRVWQKIYPNADATMLDYSYAYLANGVIGILENWVCSNYKLSIEQVGKAADGNYHEWSEFPGAGGFGL